MFPSTNFSISSLRRGCLAALFISLSDEPMERQERMRGVTTNSKFNVLIPERFCGRKSVAKFIGHQMYRSSLAIPVFMNEYASHSVRCHYCSIRGKRVGGIKHVVEP